MFYDDIFLHRITFELVGFVPSIVVDMSCTNAIVLKQKNSWLTALGNFDDMQNHCELPMKNNITSKYLWKHSILYPFPMIFDIAQNVHLVIPMEKKRTPNKNILWWSIIDFNFDGQKKIDP